MTGNERKEFEKEVRPVKMVLVKVSQVDMAEKQHTHVFDRSGALRSK